MADSADRVPLRKDAPSPTNISRAELLDLHRTLMEEYRFQAKLNSDRTQMYLVLNIGILTAATGLLKIGGGGAPATFAAVMILLAGVFVALIASHAVRQGHLYYRAVVYKKTLVEHLLGRLDPIEGFDNRGARLAIETTSGMADDRGILSGPTWQKRSIRWTTITGRLRLVFWFFAFVDAMVAVFTIAYNLAQ